MWVIKVIFPLVLMFSSVAQAEEIKAGEPDTTEQQDAIARAIEEALQNDVKVVFDITRGVQKAQIFVNGVLQSEHRISGAKNKAHVVEGNRFCAFTTTGTNIKPTHIHKSYYSNEHKVNLANFVTFDYDRGIGAHQGDTGGFSSGCIRQSAKGAKAVYDVVMANSVVKKGSTKLQSTNVRFDVVDNTPGRYTAECNCLKNHMRDTYSARAKRVCGLAANEKVATPLAEEKPKEQQPKPKPKPKKPKPKPAYLDGVGLY